MAVNTFHTCLLVDVGCKLMVFDSVRAVCVAAIFLIRRAVIPVEVVFVASVIIMADEITVMAMEALLVRGATDKGMAEKFSAFKLKMTGGATNAAQGFRVVVTIVADVATQAAAAQKVIGKFKGGGRIFVDRNFFSPGKIMVGAKGAADGIHLILGREMEGVMACPHLFFMTGAAAYHHEIWMGRFADQACMCLRLGSGIFLAQMAGGAGDIMMVVKLNRVAIKARVPDGFLCLGRLGRRRLFFCLFLGTAGGKEKDEGGNDKAELSSVPAQTKLMPLWYEKRFYHGVCYRPRRDFMQLPLWPMNIM
jgi:hypothetical protein